ncbi:hypothetical protein Hanom_Chr03g00184371 [Helianthus anomalus]
MLRNRLHCCCSILWVLWFFYSCVVDSDLQGLSFSWMEEIITQYMQNLMSGTPLVPLFLSILLLGLGGRGRAFIAAYCCGYKGGQCWLGCLSTYMPFPQWVISYIWVGLGVGFSCHLNCCWAGISLGWAGVIRGWRVEPSIRYSWSYLVNRPLSLFVWSLGCIYNIPSDSHNCYDRRRLDGLGFSGVWGMHTSLRVIRKARLGEMLIRWTPFLFWIPKSKPYYHCLWPTNPFFVCFCIRGILGILGWDRLQWLSILQLVMYFIHYSHADKTLFVLEPRTAKNWAHHLWKQGCHNDRYTPLWPSNSFLIRRHQLGILMVHMLISCWDVWIFVMDPGKTNQRDVVILLNSLFKTKMMNRISNMLNIHTVGICCKKLGICSPFKMGAGFWLQKKIERVGLWLGRRWFDQNHYVWCLASVDTWSHQWVIISGHNLHLLCVNFLLHGTRNASSFLLLMTADVTAACKNSLHRLRISFVLSGCCKGSRHRCRLKFKSGYYGLESYAVCLLGLVKSLYWVNLLILNAHYWVVFLLDRCHWQACLKAHVWFIVKTMKALSPSPGYGVFWWGNRLKSSSIDVKLGLGYRMLKTVNWATMHKPTLEFDGMLSKSNTLVLGQLCRLLNAQKWVWNRLLKWLKSRPKDRSTGPRWIISVMSNGMCIGLVILGFVHIDGGYRQNPKCNLPSVFGRFWFICNTSGLGHTYSVCMCSSRYLSIPKKGQMISYFWSPKPVSGVRRGYAPLIM